MTGTMGLGKSAGFCCAQTGVLKTSQATGVSEGISTVTVVPGSGGGMRSSTEMFESNSEGLEVGKAGGDMISDFTLTASGSKPMEEPSSGEDGGEKSSSEKW